MLPLPSSTRTNCPTRRGRCCALAKLLQDRCGISRTLPSSFLRVDSWSQALETPLSPNFKLWNWIGVDVRETPLMGPSALRSVRGRAAGRRARTVPPGSRHLCARGRQRRLSLAGACAQPARLAPLLGHGRQHLPHRRHLARQPRGSRRRRHRTARDSGVWIRPYGPEDGQADDHLHLDIGYTVFEPVHEQDAVASGEAS